jgi:hypothetical protein
MSDAQIGMKLRMIPNREDNVNNRQCARHVEVSQTPETPELSTTDSAQAIYLSRSVIRALQHLHEALRVTENTCLD